MATADEVLSTMSTSDATTASVCTIDADTRVITVPEQYKLIGVESDEKVMRLPFKCPKVVGDDIDLSTLTLYINYANANEDFNSYLIDDVTVDGDYITFSWQLFRSVTAYKGNISFIVCAKIADSDGNLTTEWNTTVCKDCYVVEGLEGTAVSEEETADLLQQYLQCLNEAKTAVSSANSAKSGLQGTINDSVTAKSNLSGVITQATQAQGNLNSAVSTANDALQSLAAEDASALSNLEELRGENFNSQEILSGVADLRAYLGLYDSDVIGVQVDYKNKTYKRLGAASGLTGGSDFDQFPMFGGRKRCNVANDGTINAWYGDSTYKEDGSNGQVMVYQPAFWYLVAPVEYDKQSTGIGYHLRKANYYVSGKARAGFRLHPAFYDANGNEIDHIFFSAFEGSIYDTSASTYIKDDAQVCDASADLFCSIGGVKPASGYSQNLTRPNVEQMAQNRGTGWHGDLIKAESANQLLMLIEYAGNLQTLIEKGITDFPWTGLADDNNSSYAVNTGGTSALGNATGHADSSTQQINGQTFTNTVNGKRSVSYRGMENPWGDLWKFVCDVNIWGNGKMNGGQPYICKNFSFSESKNSDNYEAAGFCVTDKPGYISAMGYSTSCDWLFMASECKGGSALPIGDYTYITKNLNDYRIARLGGNWNDGVNAGGFYWYLGSGVDNRARYAGGRLVYVPTATTSAA